MNKPISAASSAAYKHAIKPLLFKQLPDDTHEHMVKTGGRLQTLPGAMSLMHASLAYHNETVLGQTIHGIHFANPVGLSAGLDKNFELVRLMKAVGFGFMEGGSVTLQPCPGNPRPWFYRLPANKSLVVHAGLGNHGVDQIIQNLQGYSEADYQRFPINISVAPTNLPGPSSEQAAIHDYIGSLRALKKAKLGTMYTLNISCPNTYAGEPFTDPEPLDRLLTAIDALRLQSPTFIKMPIDLPWSRFKQLAEVASQHRIAGLTIGNLAHKRTPAILRELPNEVKGNMSGKPTYELSNNLIKHTRQHFGNRFTIIGVGGIFTAEDAYTKIKYGANLVELITGLIFEGPQMVGRLNHDLVALLKKDGYHNVHEAVGSAL